VLLENLSRVNNKYYTGEIDSMQALFYYFQKVRQLDIYKENGRQFSLPTTI